MQALHKGVIGHFHDHDDDWMLERGRSRRKRTPKPEEFDWEAFFKALSPPSPLPRSKDLCIISLRDEAAGAGI